jgi:hypothetical protein
MREHVLQRDVEKAVRALKGVLMYDTSHVGIVRSMSGKVVDLNQMTGQSDLLILVASDHGPIAYAVELKTKKGRQSKAQKKWQTKVWEPRFGGHYGVCRSVDEVMEFIGKSDEWNEIRSAYERF